MEKAKPSSEKSENKGSSSDADKGKPENSGERQEGKVPAELLAEALDVDDPEKQRQIEATFKRVSMSGPFPPPSILDAYNSTVENGAERVMGYTEREQSHRFEVDNATIKYYSRGQTFGFVLGLVGVVGGLILALLGQGLVGFAAFFSSLAALVGVFVYDKATSEESV